MPAIILKKDGGPGSVSNIIEGFVQGSLAERPEAERLRIEGDFRRVAAIPENVQATVKTAEASREHSKEGLTKLAERTIGTASVAMKPHEQKVAQLAAAVAATRAKASETPSTERTTEAVLRERELRDRVSGLKDPLMAVPMYLDAIDSGDWETVRAIEAAPRAFQLVDAATRAEGAKRKAAKSSLAATLAAQEAEHGAYKIVVAAAKNDLRALAERYDVRIED
jgi:hypothetical protein